MDQKKVGGFLKELRKGKGITQEQLAENFGVSGRTVSRWETGNNMPDLDVLIQIADYYNVDLRDILDGERKSEEMNKEMESTLLKVADYSNDDKKNLITKMHIFSWIGVIALLFYVIVDYTNLNQIHILSNLSDFALGLSMGFMIVGILYTSRLMSKVRAVKMRLLKKEGKN